MGVRVISETAVDDLPLDFNEFLKEGVGTGRLVGGEPQRMGALAYLRQNAKLVPQKPAEVLTGIVGQMRAVHLHLTYFLYGTSQGPIGTNLFRIGTGFDVFGES